MTGLAAVSADPLGILVAFGAGILSFLSPCVLPLVPGYLSMVSGLSAAELAATPARSRARGAALAPAVAAGGPPMTETGGRATVAAPSREELARQRSRLFRGILGFIAGFTVVFTALGASASAIGHVLRTHQQLANTVSGIVIVAFGAVLVAMAAGVRLPMFVAGERRFAARPSLLGVWAPPIMGMAFAFGWTPCLGPVLGSVLTLASHEGTLTGGIALLIAYSLGLGVPFLLSGLAFGRLTDVVARVRSRLRYIDLVGGLILVVFGLLLVTGNLGWVSAQFSQLLNDLHLGRLATS
ncbi:MAG TPA: cytochrome c biogenesis protein CcdA [Acidimicrobiales bacterium]|nr:cytochrome c biogenesis protein CcdA [Acidimicrobiales bacterium]